MIKLDYNPLTTTKDIEILIDHVGESQFVLLGEASHGTSEFYKWRSEISKRLILEKKFSFIAVEGDWPDCFRVNRFIKGFSNSDDYKNAYDVLHSFNRWPTWMWANKEMVDLVKWLKEYNDTILNQQRLSTSTEQQVGFYGLDLYSLWDSIESIINYLKKVDPSALKNAIEAYNCFEPYNKNVEEYAHATAFVPQNCEDEIIKLLGSLKSKREVYAKDHHHLLNNEEEYFDAEQNAITAKDAEQYYRTMIRGDVNSWNLRDTHMMDTLERLIKFYHDQNNYTDNNKPKAIVWAHNTHIGDARFTDMSRSGMINLGQLVREKKGRHNTVLVGFSTYSGTVIASKKWGEKMEKMKVPPAIEGSWDNILHNIEYKRDDKNEVDKIIIFNKNSELHKIERSDNDNVSKGYDKNTGQRAIGVVYNPEYERFGNYVPTILSSRYDALLFIDNTNALSPLHIEPSEDKDLPETFPGGE
ncbi:MAG: erythromycin esterase family protein [Thermoproteota archaeon]|nr:erythromycin esterase family protein [Thermoproteota archaeon]